MNREINFIITETFCTLANFAAYLRGFVLHQSKHRVPFLNMKHAHVVTVAAAATASNEGGN